MLKASESVPERFKTVTLKGGPSNNPYNKFEVQYTVAGKKESQKTLAKPECLGLNERWVQFPKAPVELATSEEGKEEIKKLHEESKYWGHLLHDHIKQFNAKNSKRRRMLVYDLRHGEADHNAWKKVWKTEKWADVPGPEYKRQPIFEFEKKGSRYCIIDPPLTGQGEKQAKKANELFHTLRKHRFPMPKRAYVSPLYRAKQTFKHGLDGIDVEFEVMNDLREKKTGNCADILIDEFISDKPIKPPKAGTGLFDGDWMETGKDVQERAIRALDHLLTVDDSDCVVRVTHSLLIQNNLMNLEATDGNVRVLENFMLAEGGLFAYVIEGDKATTNINKPTTQDSGNNGIAKILGKDTTARLQGEVKTKPSQPAKVAGRRKSAFRNPEASTEPLEVVIEQKILDALGIKQNIDSKKIIDRKIIDSKKIINSKTTINSKTIIDSKKNVDRAKNADRTKSGVSKNVAIMKKVDRTKDSKNEVRSRLKCPR